MKKANDSLDRLIQFLSVGSKGKGEKGAYTVREIANKLGIGHEAVRKRLRRLHDAGLLETVPTAAESIDGRTMLAPAYRVKARRKPHD